MEHDKLSKVLPGFLLTVAGGLLAWYGATIYTVVDPLVVGIILGMVIRTVIGERPFLKPGLMKSTKLLIPIGIILYGTNLEFQKLFLVPTYVWLQLLVGVIIIMLLVSWIGPKIKLSKPISLLIGVGTAICGASAIIITSPVVKAKYEDTAKSLVVITALGIIGVIFWPMIGALLKMTPNDFALFSATTLHQTGLVKTAASIFGLNALSTAMLIKMARIVMIIPLILFAGVLSTYESLDEAANRSKPLDIRIPWFLWAFILSGLAFSYITPLTYYAGQIKPLAGVAWTMAMVSVGLNVDIKRVGTALPRPLILGLIAWIAVIAVFFISLTATK